MTDQPNTRYLELADAPAVQERRDFLRGLGKWSQAVIGGVLLGGGLTVSHRASAGAWINRRGGYGGGGGWINGGGGGGGGWINRRGGYYGGGGGSWINR
jgi:hypothetical protein